MYLSKILKLFILLIHVYKTVEEKNLQMQHKRYNATSTLLSKKEWHISIRENHNTEMKNKVRLAALK